MLWKLLILLSMLLSVQVAVGSLNDFRLAMSLGDHSYRGSSDCRDVPEEVLLKLQKIESLKQMSFLKGGSINEKIRDLCERKETNRRAIIKISFKDAIEAGLIVKSPKRKFLAPVLEIIKYLNRAGLKSFLGLNLEDLMDSFQKVDIYESPYGTFLGENSMLAEKKRRTAVNLFSQKKIIFNSVVAQKIEDRVIRLLLGESPQREVMFHEYLEAVGVEDAEYQKTVAFVFATAFVNSHGEPRIEQDVKKHPCQRSATSIVCQLNKAFLSAFRKDENNYKRIQLADGFRVGGGGDYDSLILKIMIGASLYVGRYDRGMNDQEYSIFISKIVIVESEKPINDIGQLDIKNLRLEIPEDVFSMNREEFDHFYQNTLRYMFDLVRKVYPPHDCDWENFKIGCKMKDTDESTSLFRDWPSSESLSRGLRFRGMDLKN